MPLSALNVLSLPALTAAPCGLALTGVHSAALKNLCSSKLDPIT